VLHDDGDAQDALQDAYLAVWLKAGSFDEAKAIPTTWLLAITRNKAIDLLRRRQHSASDSSEAADAVDDRSSALDMLISDQDQKQLDECIGRLESRPRRLIQTAFFTDTTYSELARLEAVPLGTMKSWLRRSLLRLKISMTELT
jgi:RNA polymerase sigma-70 factor (ECF subfamily)